MIVRDNAFPHVIRNSGNQDGLLGITREEEDADEADIFA
jgi:hypothetical protein